MKRKLVLFLVVAVTGLLTFGCAEEEKEVYVPSFKAMGCSASFADTDLIASGMISVILDYLQRTGNAETTIVHAPYCLNTGAALFLTLPCKKSVSPYMYCRITPPEVFAVGVHRDVVSGVEQQIGAYEAMLKRLVDAKIISDKDLIEILNSQKTIFVYGDHLMKQLSGQ